MKTRSICWILASAAALLAGCGRDNVDLAKTPAGQVTVAPVATTTASTDGSVPTAAVVLAGKANGPQDAASGVRTSGALTDAQESTAMPLPGQNNDHSAPLPTARAAGTR